jgi:DNA-binding MurR/RpiR family transcriptional regulator
MVHHDPRPPSRRCQAIRIGTLLGVKQSVQQPVSFARDFSERVAEAREKLSSNDERIVAYILEHPGEIPFMTAEALGRAVGVSRAAIVRLAYRLGYDGFTHLRDVARDEFQGGEQFQGNSIISRFLATDTDALSDANVRQDIQNLILTYRLVSEVLPGAAAAISAAANVHVIGSREDFGLAFLLHRSLHYIRPGVRLTDEAFPDEVYQLTMEDAAIALIFRRYPKLSVSLLKEAKVRGASTVLITNVPAHDFASHADHVLPTATDSPMLYRSMVAPVAVIQSLVAEIANLEPERTRKSLEAYEQFVQEQNLLLEP